MPGGMPTTAMAKAGDVADEDLIRAERMPVGATLGPAGHPLAVCRVHQLAQHVSAVLRLVADYDMKPELPPLPV